MGRRGTISGRDSTRKFLIPEAAPNRDWHLSERRALGGSA
jgi:hypothetical protein